MKRRTYETFRLAFKETSGDESDYVFFGDHYDNIEAARKALPNYFPVRPEVTDFAIYRLTMIEKRSKVDDAA